MTVNKTTHERDDDHIKRLESLILDFWLGRRSHDEIKRRLTDLGLINRHGLPAKDST